MDHVSGIDARSKAFKSIVSESLVEKDYCRRGFCLLAKRQKIKGCEVDLIFYDPSGQIVFLEVKAGAFDWVIERWCQSDQQLRQQRVLKYCLERGFKVSWMLAVVSKGQIKYLNLLDSL